MPEMVDGVAEAPLRTADDIARLLKARNLPSRREGPFVWAWILLLPVFIGGLLLSLEGGELSWLLFHTAALLTSRTIAKMSSTSSRQRAALLLSELDQTWLGPLIDALAYPNANVREIARLRLLTILPTLEDADAESLSPGRRALLFDHLNPWKAYIDPDFGSAAAGFGAAAGDDRALAGIERLATMRAINSAQRRVRKIARGLLPSAEETLYRQTLARLDSADYLSPLTQGLPADRNLSPEARAWLAEVETDSRRQPGMRFGFLIASWGVMLPYALYQTIAQWREGNFAVALLSLVGGIFATQLYRFTMTPQQLKLAAKLGSVDNVEAVGSLAELTLWPDERIRSMAIGALTRILPRLRSSDSHLLSTAQRKCLYSWLDLRHARKYAEFQEALLKALEQVGDTDSVVTVSLLAARQPASIREQRVVDSAKSCLSFLAGCADSNRNSRILLRPAGDDTHVPSLLRPARDSGTDPEVLVRVAPHISPDPTI